VICCFPTVAHALATATAARERWLVSNQVMWRCHRRLRSNLSRQNSSNNCQPHRGVAKRAREYRAVQSLTTAYARRECGRLDRGPSWVFGAKECGRHRPGASFVDVDQQTWSRRHNPTSTVITDLELVYLKPRPPRECGTGPAGRLGRRGQFRGVPADQARQHFGVRTAGCRRAGSSSRRGRGHCRCVPPSRTRSTSAFKHVYRPRRSTPSLSAVNPR